MPWVRNFINLIYPLSCLKCAIKLNPLSDRPLCDICWEKIEFNLPPFCRVCGRHLPAPNIAWQAGLPAITNNQGIGCKDCQRISYFFEKAHSVCIYDGIIKECIHFFKYKAKLSLAKPLAKLMVDFADKFLQIEDVDLILPVPLYKVKLRQRQFNQSQLLAKSFSQTFSKKLQDKLLIKIKPTPAQVRLSGVQRLRNVQGSFKVRNRQSIIEKNILLIDDVLTTGATINECAKILKEAGANKVDALTLARSI